jgi:hypothetical protein
MGSPISPCDIGIVIQGPIQSAGRVLSDLTRREYDSTYDVKRMLEEIIEIGSIPVVVTWQDQNIDGFSDENRQFIKKVVFPKATLSRVLRNDWNKNSKYRQYYSTLQGVLELKKKNCKYIVKLRTDNLVNVQDLINHILTLNSSDVDNYFYCPLINLDKPHMFYDFYSFSSISRMEKFCNVILYEKEITANIHFDVFFRWTMHELNLKRSLSDIKLIYPKYPYFNAAQLSLIRKGLVEVYRPLPKSIWTSLYWRGEQLGSLGLKEPYRFSETPTSAIVSYFDTFPFKQSMGLNIDFLSISSYLLSSRIEIQLNKLSAKLGGAKRKLLQFLRKIVYR